MFVVRWIEFWLMGRWLSNENTFLLTCTFFCVNCIIYIHHMVLMHILCNTSHGIFCSEILRFPHRKHSFMAFESLFCKTKLYFTSKTIFPKISHFMIGIKRVVPKCLLPRHTSVITELWKSQVNSLLIKFATEFLVSIFLCISPFLRCRGVW